MAEVGGAVLPAHEELVAEDFEDRVAHPPRALHFDLRCSGTRARRGGAHARQEQQVRRVQDVAAASLKYGHSTSDFTVYTPHTLAGTTESSGARLMAQYAIANTT